MGLAINHNLSAINTHRQLSINDGALSKSIEKLASGYKINSGADDPSGLSISEQLRSQISCIERAIRNTSEANNCFDIAGGALNEMNNILKKMRALAIHANNDGITSPDQIAADQSELDSGLETISRIASTTRYTNQNLLNGNKQLVFDVHTLVNEPTDHQLIDADMTRIDQIYKRSAKIAVSHAGSADKYNTNVDTSARRAYLEADNANPLCQIDDEGNLTNRQSFTLTGGLGSRMFTFDKNAHIGNIVRDINNVKSSTGVGATLTFASDARPIRTTNGVVGDGPDYDANTPATPVSGLDNGSYVYKAGDAQIYGAGLNNPDTAKISSYCVTPEAANAFRVGYNCDGDGKIYAKVVDQSTNSIEYYKDKDCTMLIGKGGADSFHPTNGSDIPGNPLNTLDGVFLTLTDNAKNLDVYEIALVGQSATDEDNVLLSGLPGWCDPDSFTMSGVNLGQNTSATGDLYYRYTPMSFKTDGSVESFRVEAFKDSSMLPSTLVATSDTVAAKALAGGANQTVRLESVKMDNGQDSGLNITLNLPGAGATALPTGQTTGSATFTNLGIRLYSLEYGSAEHIRLDNHEGQLFYQYREADTLERVMVEEQKTVRVYGHDAKIAVNGTEVITNGLTADVTTQDFSGHLVFNAGKLGTATLAVAGYEDGKIYSRATALQGMPIESNVVSSTGHSGNVIRPLPDIVTVPAVNAKGNGLFDANGNPISFIFDFSDVPDSFFEGFPASDIGRMRVQYRYDPPNTVDRVNPDLCYHLEIPPGNSRIHYDGRLIPDELYAGIVVSPTYFPGLVVRTDSLIDISKSNNDDYDSYDPNGIAMPWTTFPISNSKTFGDDPLLSITSMATQPGGSTSEVIQDFQGGMQLQLGGSENDHDRTVYSIPSMTLENLGKIEIDGVKYTLLDLASGSRASLAVDPTLAMDILAQAVDDVAGLRARLGAFQAGTLQTNANSLEVTTENLIKSESNIRDTDMASASTEFTRSQIISQAGTSMLAQANQASSNVLTLLQ